MESFIGVDAKFDAKDIASFQDCLSRHTAEGVHIRRCNKNILNTKAEWHQPALWRVRNELSREWENKNQEWVWQFWSEFVLGVTKKKENIHLFYKFNLYLIVWVLIV